MPKEFFSNRKARQLLEYNNLGTFEQLWALQTPWFEEPNQRRNGWSGVVKLSLTNEKGKTIAIFIKRQENHNCKTPLHPFKGIPTFRREFLNIKRLNKNHIPTLSTVYYGERIANEKHQSILITQSLENYQSLEDFCTNNDNKSLPQRKKIMTLAGEISRKMHDAHFRHNCFYPKHLFLKYDQYVVDIRVIDLEKLKWLPFYQNIREHDLSQLIRHSKHMTQNDLKILLSSYLTSSYTNLEHSSLAKKLWSLIKK